MKIYKKHWQSLLTVMIIGGFVLSPISAAAAGTILYEQSPGHFGGFLSDGQVFSVTDEFQLSQSQLISNITWWGDMQVQIFLHLRLIISRYSCSLMLEEPRER